STDKRYVTDAQRTVIGNTSGTNSGDQTSVTGNAGTATALQTARTINGASFNGTANITVTAAAGTLTGTTLASGVTSSSLTSAAGGTFGTAAFAAAPTGAIVGDTATQSLSGKTLVAPVISAHTATAGTAAKFTAGTLLTTAESGAIEFTAGGWFLTTDTTNGRTQSGNQNIFFLTADGAAIGPAIADFFGANSSLPTVTNGVYELNFYVFYLKTTAGTAQFNLTNTQPYTNLVAFGVVSNAAGGVGGVNTGGLGVAGATAASTNLPATSTLTTGLNHTVHIRAVAECGTAGNIRLRVTQSAGTITPLRGSFYTARRLSGNVGTFVP
ncbi:MAG: hypothetical protein H0X34_17945, partial [Chthoniobacterales bacterium]|nr:hypothetical protein [Chthoniobacterales bacterium]